MNKQNILIVLSSHDTLGNTGKGTGFHYEEMTTPYFIFSQAGYNVTLASIKGGEPPHDPSSLKSPIEENPASVIQFIENEEAMKKLEDTVPINKVNADDFAAVYLPGGHGTMWDFPENKHLAEIVSKVYQAGKPVAAVCHGIAGFLSATGQKDEPLVNDKRINSFTDSEEKAIELQDVVPFLLENRLRELGAKFECSENFQQHLVVDKNIITGQNPASAEAVADSVVKYLKTVLAKIA